MAKNKLKQDIKKPDIVIRTFAYIFNWVRENLKLCIAGIVGIIVICFCVFAYTLYEKKQDDKVQYMLSQGIQGFAEFSTTGNEEALKKAEDAMNKVVNEKRKKTQSIAKLYLGKIYYIKGKIEDSKKMYREAQNESNEPAIKMLSEKALSYIENKQTR
ncbi:MAG: tetratricopeptide repeat protein [Proteobacteria bacterium]|nr:tetratricopeptide repeat protein [Pseudomonadota bacterium]